MATINVPEISAGQLTRRVTNYFEHMLSAKIPCRQIRPIMLFGYTGVGKSTSVYEIGRQLSEKIKMPVEVVDIRLTTCTITDLIGIPSPNPEKTETRWLRPDIFPTEEQAQGKLYIFFFDELDKASPAVQGAALQMILDRKAWKHAFPENTLVMAAANPARGVKGYETRLTPELLNRFKSFNVQPTLDSFREWAVQNHVHHTVMGFLGFKGQEALYAENEAGDIAFPTPRSWKSVSDTMNAFEGTEYSAKDLFLDIAGEIGPGMANEFVGWCGIFKDLPSIEGVFKGTEKKEVVKKMDMLHAVIAAFVDYINRNAETITVPELRNAVRYLKNVPPDFVTLFFRDVMEIQGMELKMMKVPEYAEWASKEV